MKRVFLSLFLSLATSLCATATTVERLTLDDLVRKAHTIVHGKVRNARTYWSSNRKLILTTYTLDVHETMKGPQRKSIEVTAIGGTIGDTTLVVSGMPSFERDEDAVVFVETSSGFSTVVGLAQGKFSVRNGDVSNKLSQLAFPDGRGGAPLQMRLQDFKRQIENRVR